MRPISIGYRSPKEKTPLSYDVFVTSPEIILLDRQEIRFFVSANGI
jgi:hypothetical protein